MDFKEQVVHDLTKEYTFNNFDFKNQSPEELLKLYQQTFEKINTVLKNQRTDMISKSVEMFNKLNL